MILNDKVFTKSGRRYPGHYTIREVTIKGEHIEDLVEQIDTFETIWGATMSGRVTCLDTTNMLRRLDIAGGEEVVIHVDDGVDEMRMVFKLFKVGDRKQVRAGALKYVLFLTTPEGVLDSWVRNSRSYDSVYAEAAIEDVVRNERWLNSDRPLLTSPTARSLCFVVPTFWTPLQTISWIASNATSADDRYRGANFLFYEDYQGFRFVPLQNLLNQEENKPYARLKVSPLRTTKDDRLSFDSRIPDDMLQLENYDVSYGSDILENALEGMYANRATIVDLTTRQTAKNDFDYLDDFYDQPHLRGLDGKSHRPLTPFNMPATDSPETHERVILKYDGLYTNEAPMGLGVDKWVPSKISILQQLRNFNVTGMLPGHIGMRAGMTVELELPSPEFTSRDNRIEIDESYSGGYLVTALRRVFQPDRCHIFVEMSKDARGIDQDDSLVP